MHEKIKLRTFVKDDTAITWKWRNQQAVQDHFSGHPYAVTREQEEDWFERSVLNNESQQVFAIEKLSDSKLVGLTFLKNINKINLQAEFAILIDEQSSGHGYGTRACFKTLEYAFQQLKLHRVFLKVRVDNEPAIRLYETCGFKKEGELRDDVFKKDKFRNQFIMGVLDSDFSMIADRSLPNS